MEYKVFVVGPIEVNCYLAIGENYLYVIDPGGDAKRLILKVRQEKKPMKAILLTHGHIDHISAVKELSEAFDRPPVYLHEKDHQLYFSDQNCLPPFFLPIKDPAPLVSKIETEDFKIIHTPGHTQGSTCFYFEADKILMSGDTLFNCSIGRTDLPGGNSNTIISSIKKELLTLPEDVKVFPGHGDPTTIKQEKRNNPFLQ